MTTNMVYHAAIRGIQLDEVESNLEGDIDLRGFLGLSDEARRGYPKVRVGILQDLGLENVHVHTGDGTKGLPEHAPYAGIIVTAAAPTIPRPLLDQLEDGGRLVIPVGSRGGQVLERWVRHGERYDYESIIPVAFVPLVGEQGWKD